MSSLNGPCRTSQSVELFSLLRGCIFPLTSCTSHLYFILCAALYFLLSSSITSFNKYFCPSCLSQYWFLSIGFTALTSVVPETFPMSCLSAGIYLRSWQVAPHFSVFCSEPVPFLPARLGGQCYLVLAHQIVYQFI